MKIVQGRLGKTRRARWSDVVAKSPRNGRAWMNYGLTRMARGAYGEAKSSFERAATMTPNYWALEINRGIVEGELGDLVVNDVAAAREAAKAQSQGTYQFSYFKIVKDTHHSFYEVHFKSNYSGEPDLKYCVAIYCQQGWDPKTSQTSVRLMSNERQPMGMAAHGADCSNKQAPVKRRLQR